MTPKSKNAERRKICEMGSGPVNMRHPANKVTVLVYWSLRASGHEQTTGLRESLSVISQSIPYEVGLRMNELIALNFGPVLLTERTV